MLLKALIYITFLLFSLGQLGRVSFFNQEINIYAYEIFLFITLGVLFFRYRLKPLIIDCKKFPLVFWTLFAFLASYIINLFSYSPFQNGVALLYFLRLILYLGYWGYLGYWVKKNPQSRRHIASGFFIFVGLTIISSLVQYLFYPDLRNLIYLGWDPHLNRMFGVFFDTSVAAAIFGMIFFFMVIFGRQMIQNKFLLYGIIGIFCLFLILTFSRSAYLAFVFCLLFFCIWQREVRFMIILLSFFVFFILVVPKQFGFGVGLTRTFSIDSRIADYKEGITLWSKNPIFGIGYNRIRYVKLDLPRGHSASSFSSSYLIILVTGGILGLLGFLGILGKFWLINKKARAALLFLMILSFTDNIILHPFILFLLGSMMVIAVNPLSGRLRR